MGAAICFQLLYGVEDCSCAGRISILLEEIGLTLYERKALASLMVQGVADAETLCREAEVPSSKILPGDGETCPPGPGGKSSPTRPKLYSALPSDDVVNQLIEISRRDTEQFSKQAEKLRAALQRTRGTSSRTQKPLSIWHSESRAM